MPFCGEYGSGFAGRSDGVYGKKVKRLEYRGGRGKAHRVQGDLGIKARGKQNRIRLEAGRGRPEFLPHEVRGYANRRRRNGEMGVSICVDLCRLEMATAAGRVRGIA